MKKRFWFPFYSEAYYSGTRELSLEARSCYLDLLCLQWDRGPFEEPLPYSKIERQLALWCGVTARQFRRIWNELKAKFEPIIGGKFANYRLINERLSADNASKKGSNAVKSRKARPVLDQSPAKVVTSTVTSTVIKKETNTLELLAPSALSEFDFEVIYKAYPRKLGKTAGLKKCRSDIKAQSDYDQLLKAVSNYSRHVNGIDPQYVKHFSTFMASWRDWIEWTANGTDKKSAVKPSQEVDFDEWITRGTRKMGCDRDQ